MIENAIALQTTTRFAMPSSLMARRLVALHGWPWIAALAVLALSAALGAAGGDLRWLIVAFMVICLLAPMVMAFLYFHYGLRPGCVVNVLPHTCTLTPSGLQVDVWRRPAPDDPEPTEEIPPARTRTFPYASIRPWTVGLDSVTLPLAPDCGGGFIWIPARAFDSPGDFTIFMKLLGQAMSRTSTVPNPLKQ